jgi:AMMECR1 domain-containing protein
LLEYLETGRVLQPPQDLDREYDSAGGAWVSLRSRDDVYQRHARDGFWHFPGEERWSAAEGVVRAALRCASGASALSRELLDSSNIAVTFFSQLEPSTVGQLDNNRYGIVVRSDVRPWMMGGALPHMPNIAGEWQQYQHARIRNGALLPHEPHTIFRHQVFKVVEPGAPWQPMGVPKLAGRAWHEDASVCSPLAERARNIAMAQLHGRTEAGLPLPSDLLPREVAYIFVAIHLDGQLRGCMGSQITELDDNIRTLT